MKVSISKTGAFLNNGESIVFMKGIKNVVNFINSTSKLEVSMEVEDANKFIKILNQLNNVDPADIESELIQYSSTFVVFKFKFKTC